MREQDENLPFDNGDDQAAKGRGDCIATARTRVPVSCFAAYSQFRCSLAPISLNADPTATERRQSVRHVDVEKERAHQGIHGGKSARLHCLALQTYVQADCWLSRTSQSQCLKHLATLLPDQSVSGALRKRLVRAKKYWSLVHRYSTRLLALVPVVCVSRVDVVPLSLLSTPSTP
jgi:hypothetical protein